MASEITSRRTSLLSWGLQCFIMFYLSQLMRLWLRKLILQSHMCSHPMGLDVWFLVRPIVYFHTSCVRTAKALARLRGCAGSPEPSLVAYVINNLMSWLIYLTRIPDNVDSLNNERMTSFDYGYWTYTYWTCKMNLVTRKPVFGVSDQVKLKPACSATETS